MKTGVSMKRMKQYTPMAYHAPVLDVRHNAQVHLQANQIKAPASAGAISKSLVECNARYGSGAAEVAWSILAMVQARAHFDDIGPQPIVDHVGEPARDDPAEIAMREWPQFRRQHKQIENAPEFITKRRTEPGTLAFVVAVDLLNIIARARRERENVPGRQRRRALSSSAEIVACSVGSARRRSSSSRCQSGTGTSAADAVRLSQMSSTSRRRSAAGRWRISSRRAGRVIL